jgi:hypothetical protein
METPDGVHAPEMKTYLATHAGGIKSIDEYDDVKAKCRPQRWREHENEELEKEVAVTELFEVFALDAQDNVVRVSINPMAVLTIWEMSPNWDPS